MCCEWYALDRLSLKEIPCQKRRGHCLECPQNGKFSEFCLEVPCAASGMSEQNSSLQSTNEDTAKTMPGKADNRKKSSSSFLTRCLLEEYAKLETEAAACKTLYEKAYVGAYGSKDPLLSQVLRDVLPRDSTKDLFSPRRREICQAFVSFFGWVCLYPSMIDGELPCDISQHMSWRVGNGNRGTYLVRRRLCSVRSTSEVQ